MKNQAAAKNIKSRWQFEWINPVLDKEFRLRMRTPRTMWTLFSYLFVIGLVALSAIYLTQVMSGRGGAFNPDQSKFLFIFLSLAQLGLVAFMAPGLTAGVISGEREKQTLNLLLTTQQSSSTIILSKLFSSLSFMILIVISTIPIYSMIFLYGGVSPKQMILVFLFYVFTMFVLGSFGILFSTILKRTMVSVIVTYGITLFIFVGTVVVYYVVMGITEQSNYNSGGANLKDYSWVGNILAWNPAAALYSILDPSVTDLIYNGNNYYNNQQISAPMQLWQQFIIIYSVLSSLSLWLAVRKLRPRLKR